MSEVLDRSITASYHVITYPHTCTHARRLWLLARDGVPLPQVPRLLRSQPGGSGRAYNDVIMGPANRADVLLKCDVPGTYVLASAAGPFHTNYDSEYCT